MSPSNSTIAFFGATGGCTNACLAHTLRAGHHTVALARTPAKLTSQLLSQGLSPATLDTQLRIVQGDARPGGQPRLVEKIVSGIGGTLFLQRKNSLVLRLTLDNPTITEDTTKALLTALRDIYARYPSLSSNNRNSKPLLTVISTTGLSKNPNDVPLLFRPMYHTLLAESSQRLFRGVIVVRPSLLIGDHSITTGKWWRTLQIGTEEKPAVGYTARADVGEWIFEEVKVTLTS
ncbi:hypothetical protein M432DRAFT_632116 [Thermoascus aurantiacus ATCC 26904]